MHLYPSCFSHKSKFHNLIETNNYVKYDVALRFTYENIHDTLGT